MPAREADGPVHGLRPDPAEPEGEQLPGRVDLRRLRGPGRENKRSLIDSYYGAIAPRVEHVVQHEPRRRFCARASAGRSAVSRCRPDRATTAAISATGRFTAPDIVTPAFLLDSGPAGPYRAAAVPGSVDRQQPADRLVGRRQHGEPSGLLRQLDAVRAARSASRSDGRGGLQRLVRQGPADGPHHRESGADVQSGGADCAGRRGEREGRCSTRSSGTRRMRRSWASTCRIRSSSIRRFRRPGRWRRRSGRSRSTTTSVSRWAAATSQAARTTTPWSSS